MPEIVGLEQHGVWQLHFGRAVRAASCGGMSWGPAETGRSHELGAVGGAREKTARYRVCQKVNYKMALKPVENHTNW